ncbi:hypothetical protein Mame01_56350 [Microbispora amethystogenes]|nr:hypothetical protein Mame01_56350 [Microbispora amethystogenes]
MPDLSAVDGEAAGRAGEHSEGALGDVQGRPVQAGQVGWVRRHRVLHGERDFASSNPVVGVASGTAPAPIPDCFWHASGIWWCGMSAGVRQSGARGTQVLSPGLTAHAEAAPEAAAALEARI